MRCALAKRADIPVYEEILLNAIGDYWSRKYNTAIVYSAIAMETMVRTLLRQEHSRMLSSRPPRWVKAGEGKDFVFEKLFGAREFKVLLNDCMLYVFGRSLLVEDKKLYDNACKLYRTRSELVHQGHLKLAMHIRYFQSTQEEVTKPFTPPSKFSSGLERSDFLDWNPEDWRTRGSTLRVLSPKAKAALE